MQNFLITLLICSVTMSALALLYMVVTPFLAKRYSEKGQYYAWLIIVVGLLVPFRPQLGNALINVEVPASTLPPAAQIDGTLPSHFLSPITLPPIENVIISDTSWNFSWWQIGFAVWLAGLVVFISYHGMKHYHFVKMTRRWSTHITDEQILSLFQCLKSEMCK